MLTPALTAPILQRHACGSLIQRILFAALHAVDPEAAVRRHMRRQGDLLAIGEMNYHLDEFEKVTLVAVGKAGAPMARAAAAILGERLAQGIVLVKDGYQADLPGMHVFTAGHPVPDERGEAPPGRS